MAHRLAAPPPDGRPGRPCGGSAGAAGPTGHRAGPVASRTLTPAAAGRGSTVVGPRRTLCLLAAGGRAWSRPAAGGGARPRRATRARGRPRRGPARGPCPARRSGPEHHDQRGSGTPGPVPRIRRGAAVDLSRRSDAAFGLGSTALPVDRALRAASRSGRPATTESATGRACSPTRTRCSCGTAPRCSAAPPPRTARGRHLIRPRCTPPPPPVAGRTPGPSGWSAGSRPRCRPSSSSSARPASRPSPPALSESLTSVATAGDVDTVPVAGQVRERHGERVLQGAVIQVVQRPSTRREERSVSDSASSTRLTVAVTLISTVAALAGALGGVILSNDYSRRSLDAQLVHDDESRSLERVIGAASAYVAVAEALKTLELIACDNEGLDLNPAVGKVVTARAALLVVAHESVVSSTDALYSDLLAIQQTDRTGAACQNLLLNMDIQYKQHLSQLLTALHSKSP